jgi:hypothetical protein
MQNDEINEAKRILKGADSDPEEVKAIVKELKASFNFGMASPRKSDKRDGSKTAHCAGWFPCSKAPSLDI